MATSPTTVAYLLEQLAGVPDITARKMFGEYTIYCGEKIVALVCDDQLFVKPTAAGKIQLGAPIEAPPYKGANPCYLITADAWENAEWLSELIRDSAAQLPKPKPRKQKA